MPDILTLPDPLRFNDGTPVADPADWPARRMELLAMLQEIQYGWLPPAPSAVTVYLLHRYTLPNDREVTGTYYRVTAEPYGLSFFVRVIMPPGPGPFPVIIDGDMCWQYLTNEIMVTAARSGYALALFNRVEIVPDNDTSARDFGLYTAFPEGEYGALAAWAWGYHRVVDLLQQLPGINQEQVIATGHSRGGKTVLLAGATDARIALTAPNNSGCGGAGCSRYPDDGGERLADILHNLPYWFSPRLADYVGREEALPFDQHSLKAAVAPRALLTTEALGDIWASPRGTWRTYAAAREVYRFLGVESRIGIHYREGEHAHTLQDWETLLDFADVQFRGTPPKRDFAMNPWALDQ